ncbi:MAG: outer membrane protein assembly factor BamE [Novosphingobium sp.]|nr:outer membrane protein assembly factor BamE [Novosphingobium sp.]
MRFDRHKLWLAGAALGLGALAGGCTSIRDHRGYIVDSALTDAIQPGIDNRASVEQTLGRPTFVSQFGNKDWYYISQNTKTPAFRKTRTEGQTVLRLRFDEAGNLVAVERRGMERVARIDPEGDKTRTLGRDRSFLEDLFGNIGAVGVPGGGPTPGM